MEAGKCGNVCTLLNRADKEHLAGAAFDARGGVAGCNDPEGVAFEYEVLERKRPPTEAALLPQAVTVPRVLI
jgi:hypothetical protein